MEPIRSTGNQSTPKKPTSRTKKNTTPSKKNQQGTKPQTTTGTRKPKTTRKPISVAKPSVTKPTRSTRKPTTTTRKPKPSTAKPKPNKKPRPPSVKELGLSIRKPAPNVVPQPKPKPHPKTKPIPKKIKAKKPKKPSSRNARLPRPRPIQQNFRPVAYNYAQQPSITNPHKEWAMKEDVLTNIAAPTTESGDQIDIDLKNCLSINTRLGSDAVLAKTTSQTLPLLINLKEVNFDELDIEIESKVDLVCAIDISGSMMGKKIDYVKKTMLKLLEFLGNGHRLAIVVFDDKASTFMNFKLVNDENIVKISEIINAITHCGQTNITDGVHQAQKVLGLRKSKNHVSCVFLLGDGQHNMGPINMDVLYKDELKKAKCDYTLTSFGYGDDHDANLLQEMSEKKGGNYYFINDITKVEECFVDSLAMVTSILGQNIKASLKLAPSQIFPEIRIKKTYGPYWKCLSPIEAQVLMSSFYSGFDKNFLCLLAMDPIKEGDLDDEQEIVIGNLELKIDTLASPPQTITFNREIKLRVLPHDSDELIAENEVVQEQMSRVQGAEAIELADQLNEKREYDQAIEVLENFTEKLQKKQYKHKELFVKMKDSVEQQKKMITNNKKGVRNAFKTKNFCKQSKNIYMNEQSAPTWSKGLYQNKKMKKRMVMKKSKF